MSRKNGRAYRVWDLAEEAALKAGVRKHGMGAWERIRTDDEFSILLSRTGVQLKDKWRNLVKFRHITPTETLALPRKTSGPWHIVARAASGQRLTVLAAAGDSSARNCAQTAAEAAADTDIDEDELLMIPDDDDDDWEIGCESKSRGCSGCKKRRVISTGGGRGISNRRRHSTGGGGVEATAVCRAGPAANDSGSSVQQGHGRAGCTIQCDATQAAAAAAAAAAAVAAATPQGFLLQSLDPETLTHAPGSSLSGLINGGRFTPSLQPSLPLQPLLDQLAATSAVPAHQDGAGGHLEPAGASAAVAAGVCSRPHAAAGSSSCFDSSNNGAAGPQQAAMVVRTVARKQRSVLPQPQPQGRDDNPTSCATAAGAGDEKPPALAADRSVWPTAMQRVLLEQHQQELQELLAAGSGSGGDGGAAAAVEQELQRGPSAASRAAADSPSPLMPVITEQAGQLTQGLALGCLYPPWVPLKKRITTDAERWGLLPPGTPQLPPSYAQAATLAETAAAAGQERRATPDPLASAQLAATLASDMQSNIGSWALSHTPPLMKMLQAGVSDA